MSIKMAKAKVITALECRFHQEGNICAQTERSVCDKKPCKVTVEGDSDG